MSAAQAIRAARNEARAAEREAEVRESKPILRALVDDFRTASEREMHGGRREQLENLVVYFSVSLSNPREGDCTQEEADAARATFGVSARNTKAPALL